MRLPAKITTLLSLLAIAASCLAVERKPIVIWGQALGPDSKGFEAVIREFEKRHPEYEIHALGLGAGNMNPQKLMTSIVGKVAPDAVYQDRFTISDWASRGAFQSLQDLVDRDKNQPNSPKPEQYYPSVWAEATWQGQVFGIPSGADDRVLYYNKAIFKAKAAELRAAGLDPDRPPKTWSEILAYSKVLTEKSPGGTIKIAGFLPNYGNSWLYLYTFQMDGNFLTKDGRTCTLDSPESEVALKFMKDGYDLVGGYGQSKNFESGFQGNENDPFIVGKVAMKIDGDWIINTISRYGTALDFGVAPAPVPDDRYAKKGKFATDKDTFITWLGGYCYGIPTGARNREGAWEFIKFATSTEGRVLEHTAQRESERRRGRLYVPRLSGQIETNQIILKDFVPADDRIAAALRMHVQMLPNGYIRPATFAGQRLWDEHVRATEAGCTTGDIKGSLLDSQNVVQRELDAYYRTETLPVVDLRIPAIGVGIIAICGALAIWFGFRRLRLGKLAKADSKWAYLFVSPWVIGFLVLTLGPMLASLFFSFTQYNVLSPARWVGMENYSALVGEDRQMSVKVMMNVLYLAGVGVPLSILSGLAIALLLNNAVKGMRIYRTLYYMPAIVPVVAAAVLWTWVLAADPNKGLLNAGWKATFGQWFNLAPPGWLTMPEYTKQSLVLMGVWGAGSGMLLWLAGLKGIPVQLYEASSLDGASPTRQLWSITLPQLSPVIFFNVVVGVIAAVQEFDRPYVLLGGQPSPGDSLLMPVIHLFNNAFTYFKMGYASALAWFIFLLILGLTLIQFRLSSKWVHYEADK